MRRNLTLTGTVRRYLLPSIADPAVTVTTDQDIRYRYRATGQYCIFVSYTYCSAHLVVRFCQEASGFIPLEYEYQFWSICICRFTS